MEKPQSKPEENLKKQAASLPKSTVIKEGKKLKLVSSGTQPKKKVPSTNNKEAAAIKGAKADSKISSNQPKGKEIDEKDKPKQIEEERKHDDSDKEDWDFKSRELGGKRDKLNQLKQNTISLDAELDNKLWKKFEQRYSGNFDFIKKLCLLQNITYDQEDPNSSLRQLYNLCKEQLEKSELDTATGLYITNLQSPYEMIANKIINKCLFLLRVATNFSKSNQVYFQ